MKTLKLLFLITFTLLFFNNISVFSQDSTFKWVKKGNYYEMNQELIGNIKQIDLINNDTLLFVTLQKYPNTETNLRFLLFNAITGNFIEEYFFPKGLNHDEIKVYSLDSILLASYVVENIYDFKYSIGIYSFMDKYYYEYFTISNEYFKNKLPNNQLMWGEVLSLNYNPMKNGILLKTLGTFTEGPYTYYKTDFENRDLESGEILNNFNDYYSITLDFNYFLKKDLKLYDKDSTLVYSIIEKNKNNNFLKDKLINEVKISPNNKFIVIYTNDHYFYIIDFKTGILLHKIFYKIQYNPTFEFSYNDNTLYVKSNADNNAIQIYNLVKGNIFDQITFPEGLAQWVSSNSKTSNKFIFGGYDGFLRMWEAQDDISNIETEVSSFNIYPNPTSDFINIVSEDYNSKIEIFNHLGETVLTTENNSQIYVGDLIRGVYYLRLGNKTQMFVRN